MVPLKNKQKQANLLCLLVCTLLVLVYDGLRQDFKKQRHTLKTMPIF